MVIQRDRLDSSTEEEEDGSNRKYRRKVGGSKNREFSQTGRAETRETRAVKLTLTKV